MNKSALTQRFFVIVFLLLSGCDSSADVQVTELSTNTVSYDETIHINNCGGKADSEQTASRSFATTIEGGAEFKAGYKMIVEGGISAKYSQYRNTTKSMRLLAPPGTNMEFVLRWSEEVHAGNVTVDGSTGTYEVRVPIAVEQVSSQDLGGCSGEIVPIQPTSSGGATVLPSPTIISSTALILNHYKNFGYECTWVNYDFTIWKCKITDVIINGNNLVMKYDFDDGILDGTLSGNVYSGNWRQVGRSGSFELIFNASDFSSATGWWNDSSHGEIGRAHV